MAETKEKAWVSSDNLETYTEIMREFIHEYVAKQLAPLQARIAELEAKPEKQNIDLSKRHFRGALGLGIEIGVEK